MIWDFKKYGSVDDPIRQSDLNELASSYSCPKRFAFKKDEQFGGEAKGRERAYGTACIGTGVHETNARYLDPTKSACARILAGELPSEEAVRRVLEEEVEKAAEGLPIEWKASRDTEIAAGVAMVLGALRGTSERASEVVLVEAPFLVEIKIAAKSYWLTGTVDLVYRPRENPFGLGLADWKTGQTRPSEIVLDHGYQLGIYAHALADGVFFPGTEREVRLEQFPDELHIVHLRDYVPYAKAGSKKPTHRDELAHYGIEPGDKISYVKGDMRGPAWHRARRTELDVQRLKASIRNIVSTVRLGRFVENLGDDCARCAFKHACLNEGFAVDGDAKKRLDLALRDVDFDGLGDDFAA